MTVYRGYTRITSDQFANYSTGHNLHELVQNQYVVLEDGHDMILFFNGKNFESIKTMKFKGFKANNLQQKMAMDLLGRQDVPIKIIIGPPGSGKSALSLKVGVESVRNGDQEKLIVVRHNVESGRKVGYLPGDISDKGDVWIENIIDLLDGKEYEFAEMRAKGQIETQLPAFAQGRNFRGFTLVDEAQNLNRDQIIMLGSRIVDKGQIVFAGDVRQTADREFKGNKNGLKLLLDKLVGNPLVGVVMLDEVVRGRVANVFAKLLEEEELNG